MKIQTPGGTPPAAPAKPVDGPSGGQQEGQTVQPTTLPSALSGSGPVLWGTVIGAALIFFMLLYFIMRARIGGRAARVEEPRKTNEVDFFKPAGDDAEITFEDGVTVIRGAELDSPIAPKPRRNALFGFGRKRAEAELAPEPEAAFTDSEPEAEVVIERAEAIIDELKASVPKAKKPAPFANLFSRKKREEEEPLMPAPPANDETDETVVEIIPAGESDEPERERASAGALARSVFAAARNEDDDWRRRLEDERRAAAERADEERRIAAEDDLRRDFDRRAQAEREAEFERRKLAASLDQRIQTLDARERALKDRELSSSLDAGAMRAEIQREFDAKFAELSQRFERRAAPAPTDAPTLLRDLDQRISRLAERTEARAPFGVPLGGPSGAPMGAPMGAPGDYGDDRPGSVSPGGVGEITRRIAEHRDSINATLEQMQSRMDLIAGAPQEVRALRDEMVSLKRALGERVTGPNAPIVQLSDIVRNALPPDAYEMRAMLPNNRKADCIVRLAHPPGPIAIDARFPIEAFAKLHQGGENDPRAENEFRRAALRHIVDIAERLIIPDETADSALMFIPSETMYSEFHARFPDVVQDSYRARVWIVSPTTLMATLHTMRAVLRDAQARQNTDLIQSEAGHVLSEVEALRRRVVALEDNFNRVRDDFRGLLTSTDQVYRRAETISNTRRAIAEEPPARRLPMREEAPPPAPMEPRAFEPRAPELRPADPRPELRPEPPRAPTAVYPAASAQTGDLWDDRQVGEARQPFPLR